MVLEEYDYATEIAVLKEEAEERGIAIGEERGIAIGEELGSYQAKLETARILKDLGDSIEKINKATGLSIEEIEKL